MVELLSLFHTHPLFCSIILRGLSPHASQVSIEYRFLSQEIIDKSLSPTTTCIICEVFTAHYQCITSHSFICLVTFLQHDNCNFRFIEIVIFTRTNFKHFVLINSKNSAEVSTDLLTVTYVVTVRMYVLGHLTEIEGDNHPLSLFHHHRY